MLNITKKILLSLLLALPAVAMAGVITPGNGNDTWDLFTMGNGAVIAQILQATIAIVGNSSYRTLLLLVATGGFLFLAIQAGFDFGKNFLRMFSHIFVVWLVVLTSSSITVNVMVNDEVNNSHQGVANVPAVVGLPAAMITGIGHWLAQNIATAFGVDPMLSVSGGTGGGAGGGFNIFGNMMEDANNFVVTSPELKNSLAAFTGDCVVAELGMQLLTPTQLESSSNLWKDFGVNSAGQSVLPNGVMTRYYYPNTPGMAAPSTVSCPGVTTPISTSGSGSILSCPEAYSCLTQDLANHAQGLLDAKQTQWGSTGALALYNGAFQAAITQASGGNSSGGHLTPQSLVQQEALINEMHGAFRHAAVTTGDNSLLINANVAGAEQQQKSAFYVGSLVTEHMAGYVFTVLQAFLFAIVPIIIVAALIPGLGRQVATSYIQMLVWLALWEPMYEIVNFLILAFSQQSLGVTYSTWSGPTLGNQFTMSEQTSNLVAAARMLGSSVPILALGLVKGGIALEKFAAEALGGSFGNSAGSQAALGGFSEAGVNLSRTTGSSYNTASESVVGTNETSMSMGNGALLAKTPLGGASGTLGGSALGESYSAQKQLSGNTSIATDGSLGQSGAQNTAAGARVDNGHREDYSRQNGTNVSSGNTTTQGNQASVSNDTRQTHDTGHSQNVQRSANTKEGSDARAQVGGEVKDSGNVGGGNKPGAPAPAVAGAPGALGAPNGAASVAGGPAAGGHPALAAAGGHPAMAAGPAMSAAPAGGEAPAMAGAGGGKGGGGGLAGGISANGSTGVSRSFDQGLSTNDTTSSGASSSYAHAAQTSSSLGNSSSYSTGASSSAGHSAANSSSSTHTADSNSTHSDQSNLSVKASHTDSSSNSNTLSTNGGSSFQQGRIGDYLSQTHYGQDGFWDAKAAGDEIRASFIDGLAQQHMSVDQWKAGGGADWQAAHGAPTDPGIGSGGAGAAPAMPSFATKENLTAGWQSVLDDQTGTKKAVNQQTSVLGSDANTLQSTLGEASTSFFPNLHIAASPDASSGAYVSPGMSTADVYARAGIGAGGAATALGRFRASGGKSSDGAAKLAAQVKP
jgi:hypothetical protein